MYDDILIPVDSNESDSSPVVEQALFLASTSNARLHILHVVDERAYNSIPSEAREIVRDRLEEDGEDVTKRVAEQAVDNGIETRREVRWGNPTVGILAYVNENDVDMVVMGTHARTGYERFLLGSIAEKVVRTAPVPVLTTRIGDVKPETELLELGGQTIE